MSSEHETSLAEVEVRRQAVRADFSSVVREVQARSAPRVGAETLSEWLRDSSFAQSFDELVGATYRYRDLMAARCAALAATRLARLLESEQSPTPPKLLLDILSLVKPELPQGATSAGGAPIEPELAGKLLEAVAAHEAGSPGAMTEPCSEEPGSPCGRISV
ncbi:MAG: hypothetical protein ACYS74_17775 [Planctomycetota bacterium]|jgi:hypothetical protein